MEKKSIDELIEKYHFKLEETHISWVLIGNSLVYKIKKPVNFGFLDYSTLEKRLKCCEREVELNSRFSKDIYLGISKIVETGSGLDFDKDGKLADYCVRMKKIPADRMMDVLIKENRVEEKHIKALAEKIAEFHKNASANKHIAQFGTADMNKKNTDENFEQTKNAVGDYITRYQYNEVKDYTNNFYKENGKLFEERIRNNKIRDCHGDMYSRNICIENENNIHIYDCIEFNERFRYSDVASDVAFLLMDLENYSRYDLSDMFLKYYIEFSNNTELLDIVNFYKIYRAYVRGKIAFFQQNRQEANKYFDLSFGYLPKKFKPKLIMMCGLTGSGKSYLTDALKKELNAVILNSDIIRKKSAGMSLHEKDLSNFGKGIYSEEMTIKIYNEIKKLAYEFLREGKNTILDATYLLEKYRNDVKKYMKRLGIKPIVVYIDADDSTVLEHFKNREQEKSVSDGRYEIYKEQKKIFEKPKECIRVNSNDSLAGLIEKISRNA